MNSIICTLNNVTYFLSIYRGNNEIKWIENNIKINEISNVNCKIKNGTLFSDLFPCNKNMSASIINEISTLFLENLNKYIFLDFVAGTIAIFDNKEILLKFISESTYFEKLTPLISQISQQI